MATTEYRNACILEKWARAQVADRQAPNNTTNIKLYRTRQKRSRIFHKGKKGT
jgi:hypothetical protein